MPPSLKNIQALRTVLGRLNAERPAALHNRPGQTHYEDRGGDFLDRLDLELTSRRGKARVLITGQIGVGKSSELWHYLADRRTGQAGYWIFCDLEKQSHPDECGATGVLLTILRDCWGATKSLRTNRDLCRIRDEIFSRLIDWLKGEYSESRDAVSFSFHGMDFFVSLRDERKDEALAVILGKAAQHEAVSKPTERFGVAPDSLVILLNQLLDWIAGNRRGEPPILIVDHVDKIRDPEAAEDVLLRAVPHWSRIHASLVMTAPYEYTLGELRHSVESRWVLLTLYPLEFAEARTGKISPIYKKVARSAGLEP